MLYSRHSRIIFTCPLVALHSIKVYLSIYSYINGCGGNCDTICVVVSTRLKRFPSYYRANEKTRTSPPHIRKTNDEYNRMITI